MSVKTVVDHSRRMGRAIAYVEANLDGPLDIAGLAGEACLSPYHFHRLFSDYVGITVRNYVRARRLESAAWQLGDTQMTITEIALMFGYQTPSAFNKAFKSYFGMNPGAFRKQLADRTAPLAGQKATPILMKPCWSGAHWTGSNSASSAGRTAIWEMIDEGHKIGLQTVAESWLSVFPDPAPADPLLQIRFGDIDYQLFFPRNIDVLQIFSSGKLALWKDNGHWRLYHSLGALKAPQFIDRAAKLRRIPLRTKSVLTISKSAQHILPF